MTSRSVVTLIWICAQRRRVKNYPHINHVGNNDIIAIVMRKKKCWNFSHSLGLVSDNYFFTTHFDDIANGRRLFFVVVVHFIFMLIWMIFNCFFAEILCLFSIQFGDLRRTNKKCLDCRNFLVKSAYSTWTTLLE